VVVGMLAACIWLRVFRVLYKCDILVPDMNLESLD
jgi:hypothetical protein